MNEFFRGFISRSRKLAEQESLQWTIPVAENGEIPRQCQWNLSSMAGSSPNPEVRLTYLGPDPKTVTLMNSKGLASSQCDQYWEHWYDLAKAIIVTKIYISRNKPAPIKNSLVRPLFCLMAVAGNRPPWEVTAEDVQTTFVLLNELQLSHKLAHDLRSMVKIIIDRERLSNFSPVLPLIEISKNTQRITPSQIRRRLTERKHDAKLPTEQAFWEIARIVWDETPISVSDKIKFAIVRVLIMCGLRAGEAVTIPADWKHIHQYFEPSTHLPQQAIKESLALRYFAAKRRAQRQDSVSLFEAIQHIPPLFDEALSSTLDDIFRITTPMRQRLQLQCQSGRIFPEYGADELVHVFDIYTHLTGEPFLFEDPIQGDLTARWQKTYDFAILEEVEQRQRKLRASGGKLRNKVRQYFSDGLGSHSDSPEQKTGVPLRDFRGQQFSGRVSYRDAYVMIGDLERHFSHGKITKLSDTTSFNLATGQKLLPSELLFLVPKRALGEERNGMICDIRKYVFIGFFNTGDVVRALDDYQSTQGASLFGKYGFGEDKKKLGIKSHDFRHLQNTELFRLGIADTLITKRYNRNSVQQSYEYDHRSLAEELSEIEIPDDAQPYLLGKAADVYRMISGGLATGTIVDEFKRIQSSEGDAAAYSFLAVEADGLHTTPYGHCINSFTVDPCPKHLECFNGCLHLTRSPLAEHTMNLRATLGRMEQLLASIGSHPAPAAAKEKMQHQAEARVSALNKMLATPIGGQVFPDGEDLSIPIRETFSGAFSGN